MRERVTKREGARERGFDVLDVFVCQRRWICEFNLRSLALRVRPEPGPGGVLIAPQKRPLPVPSFASVTSPETIN